MKTEKEVLEAYNLLVLGLSAYSAAGDEGHPNAQAMSGAAHGLRWVLFGDPDGDSPVEASLRIVREVVQTAPPDAASA